MEVREVGKPAVLLSRHCTKGVFVLHDLPRDELELTWLWGENDCCSQICCLKVHQALQFVDLDISLKVPSSVTAGNPLGNPPVMTLRFPPLKVTGKKQMEIKPGATKLRYHCTLTVKPDVKSGNPAGPTEHTYKEQAFDCTEKICEAQYTQAILSDDAYQRKYTVTAWVDGAGQIQQKTATET